MLRRYKTGAVPLTERIPADAMMRELPTAMAPAASRRLPAVVKYEGALMLAVPARSGTACRNGAEMLSCPDLKYISLAPCRLHLQAPLPPRVVEKPPYPDVQPHRRHRDADVGRCSALFSPYSRPLPSSLTTTTVRLRQPAHKEVSVFFYSGRHVRSTRT